MGAVDFGVGWVNGVNGVLRSFDISGCSFSGGRFGGGEDERDGCR